MRGNGVKGVNGVKELRRLETGDWRLKTKDQRPTTLFLIVLSQIPLSLRLGQNAQRILQLCL